MNRKILFVLTFLMGFIIFASFMQPSATRKENVIIVGTNAEYPPFTFKADGEIVGFDIDLAKEVCHRLGKEIDLRDMPFDALIPELTLGYVDVAAAGISTNEERAKRILFTESYLSGDPLFIVSVSPEITTIADLTSKVVVVNEGYTSDLFLTTTTTLDLTRLAMPAEGFLALKTGRADAFVTARSTAMSFIAVQGDNQFHYSPIENSSENYALAISKKYPELLVPIQQALNEMEQDGTIDQLKTKWKLK